MTEGPLGGPRPFADDSGEGPGGLARPFSRTVNDCVNSVQAQRFVDNLEESMGEPIPTVEEKEALKRAWCEGVVDDDWLDKWSRGLEKIGVQGLRERLGFKD